MHSVMVVGCGGHARLSVGFAAIAFLSIVRPVFAEDVPSLLRGSARSKTGLHCCDSLVDGSPAVLACDATPHDFIIAVPFAAFGKAPTPGEHLYHCGVEDFPTSCSKRLEHTAAVKGCIGRQLCSIDLASLEVPCPNETSLQFRVRWACHCDAVTCGSGPTPLPPLPLHADGNIIRDASGSRLRLHGVNWAGAHSNHAPDGLNHAPLGSLARLVRTLGFNVVRLVWSVEAVLTNPVVEDRVVAANPALVGLRFLDVFDEVVDALQHEGILIWLDNHMLDSGWCCDRQDCNGLWFNSRFSEDDWVDAWRIIANRYAKVSAFVGAGLKNEPHSVCGGRSWNGRGQFCNATCWDPAANPMGCVEMEWSKGPEQLQWRRAATRAGIAVLEEKGNLLVSISGLEYSSDLRDFAAQPVGLPRKNVVYEAHEYSWATFSRWAGKYVAGTIAGHEQPLKEGDAKGLCNDLGGECSGVTCASGLLNCTVRTGAVLLGSQTGEITHWKELQGGEPFPRYGDKLTEWWGHLLVAKAAPVFLSEFGFDHGFAKSPTDHSWIRHLSSYIQEAGPLADKGGLDWAYWQLAGVQSGGTSRTAGATETYGVLNRCWTAPAFAEHYGIIRQLMSPPSRAGAAHFAS